MSGGGRPRKGGMSNSLKPLNSGIFLFIKIILKVRNKIIKI